jgi:tRNA-2-methylthio-N6-dimethylallyladenosine synthase
VLFEKSGKRAGQIVGKTPYLQTVQVMAPASLIGEIHPVTITDLGSFTLFGTLARQVSEGEPLLVAGA